MGINTSVLPCQAIRNFGTAHLSTRRARMTSLVRFQVWLDFKKARAGQVSSFVPAAFRDQLHGRLAYPRVPRRTRAMKAFAPGKRRDIRIFVHRLVRDKS